MGRPAFKTPELLAPAGNLEKLKTAFEFGADAVYFGLPDFSLRVRVNQFDKDAIREGAKICREKGKRFYVTLNIYAHNSHLKKLPEYFEFLKEVQPNGLIISDPGILKLAKEHLPQTELHLSTQANATNIEAVKFWKAQGVKRVILARELSLEEVSEIKKAVPEVELECFVHGAMCMSYSGRCILSKWMTGRSANLGDCAQPCRWLYHPKETKISEPLSELELTDEKDRFEIKVEEDQHGTYLFNSYDVCLLEHLQALSEAGIDSFKIEGRAKSVYYLAVVTKAYRKVLDQLGQGDVSLTRKVLDQQKRELETLANRGYSQGFLLGSEPPHLFKKDAHRSQWMFCGISHDKETAAQRNVYVHNFVKKGEQVEVITKDDIFTREVVDIIGSAGERIASAHGGGGKPFLLTFSEKIKGTFLIRKPLVGA